MCHHFYHYYMLSFGCMMMRNRLLFLGYVNLGLVYFCYCNCRLIWFFTCSIVYQAGPYILNLSQLFPLSASLQICTTPIPFLFIR